MLRAKLLEGRRIALAGNLDAVGQALRGLGAELERVPLEELPGEEERVGEWARARSPLHGLVYSAASTFGSGGDRALLATLDEAWAAVREVAVGALIEVEEPGKLVLIAPGAQAGDLVEAARAGLENLARTLSVEWARHGLSAVLVAPGAGSTETQVATLVCFLVSEAAGYLSGCRLDLGIVQ